MSSPNTLNICFCNYMIIHCCEKFLPFKAAHAHFLIHIFHKPLGAILHGGKELLPDSIQYWPSCCISLCVCFKKHTIAACN